MELKIGSLDAVSITTSAPLEPNRNMHGTGFAGSLYSLAVATGWALVHNRVDLACLSGQLVVKKAVIHYKRPVMADIELAANIDSDVSNDALKEQLFSKGRIDFPLIVNIYSKGKKCGYLEANYVVVA